MSEDAPDASCIVNLEIHTWHMSVTVFGVTGANAGCGICKKIKF